MKEEREEAERKEQEEFEKWKHLFSVDAEGETAVEEEQENQASKSVHTSAVRSCIDNGWCRVC